MSDIELPKHDGYLDAYEPGSGCHVECRIVPPGVALLAEDITGTTVYHIYLEPEQSLSMLAWLEQERETLQKYALDNVAGVSDE